MPKTVLQWRRVTFAASRFAAIFRAQLMRNDLERLCKWARRKRLKPVYLHYKRLHANTEVLLAEMKIRFLKTYLLAEFAHAFYNQIAPGSAGRSIDNLSATIAPHRF